MYRHEAQQRFRSPQHIWIAKDSKLPQVGRPASVSIAPDEREYPHNIFLISPQKHMLWVLI